MQDQAVRSRIILKSKMYKLCIVFLLKPWLTHIFFLEDIFTEIYLSLMLEYFFSHKCRDFGNKRTLQHNRKMDKLNFMLNTNIFQ